MKTTLCLELVIKNNLLNFSCCEAVFNEFILIRHIWTISKFKFERSG